MKCCEVQITRLINLTPSEQTWNSPFNCLSAAKAVCLSVSWERHGNCCNNFQVDCLHRGMAFCSDSIAKANQEENLTHLATSQSPSLFKPLAFQKCSAQKLFRLTAPPPPLPPRQERSMHLAKTVFVNWEMISSFRFSVCLIHWGTHGKHSQQLLQREFVRSPNWQQETNLFSAPNKCSAPLHFDSMSGRVWQCFKKVSMFQKQNSTHLLWFMKFYSTFNINHRGYCPDSWFLLQSLASNLMKNWPCRPGPADEVLDLSALGDFPQQPRGRT